MTDLTTINSLQNLTTQIINHPLLSVALSALAILVMIWLSSRQGRANQQRARLDNLYRLQAYPFISDSSDDLSQLVESSIGPTSTVQYAPRFPGAKIAEDQILATNRVLIIGREGIGKTREAIEAIKQLAAQEADPVTVFRPNGYIGYPMNTEQLVEFSKRPVLLIDDIDNYYAADDKDANERFGSEALHDRLVEAVDWFSLQSSRLRVICTAQDDSFILALEPVQQEFWGTFTTIQLPELHKSVLIPFIEQLAQECEYEVDPDAISYIARKTDATYKGLIDAFYRMKNTDHAPRKLTLSDVQKMRFTWPINWDVDVFSTEIDSKPLHRLIFEALGVIENFWIPPYKRIVVDLTSRMYSKYFFGFVRKRVTNAITGDLKRWMKISPSGQIICRSAYVQGKGDVEDMYPALLRTFIALPPSEKERLLADIYQISQRVLDVTGDNAKALSIVQVFAETLPRTIPVLTAQRALYLAQQDFTNAIRVSEQIAQIAPSVVTLHQKSLTYGVAAKNENKRSEKVLLHKKSINAAKEVIEIDSSFPPAFQSLAISYSEIKDFHNSIAAAKKLTDIRGHSGDWFTLGVALGKAGKHEESSKATRHAVKLNPRYIDAWKSLIRNMNMQSEISVKQKMEAINSLVNLASQSKDWVAVSIAYGRAAEIAETDELKRNFHTRAIVEAKKALELDERNIDAMRSLRVNYGQISSEGEAIFWGQKLLDISESSSDWFAMGVALGKSGEFTKASKAARKATELDPQNEEAWNSLVINSGAAKDVESELAALKSLTSIFDKATYWQQLSAVYGKQGHHSEAEYAAKKAIEIDPDHEASINSLVYALLKQDKFDEAEKYEAIVHNLSMWVFNKVDKLKHEESPKEVVEFLRERVKKGPDNHDYWQVLGASLRKLGVMLRNNEGDTVNARRHFEEAIEAHNEALSLAPDGIGEHKLASMWYAKGRAFLELENLVNACVCFKKALNLNPDHPEASRYQHKYCQTAETDVSD